MQVDQRESPKMKENGVPRVKYILVAVLQRAREDERLEDESLSQETPEEGFRYLYIFGAYLSIIFKRYFQFYLCELTAYGEVTSLQNLLLSVLKTGAENHSVPLF